MQALLFADRPGKALLPPAERICAALLSVVGNPLIVFALGDLAFADFREPLVMVCGQADLVERELCGGARRGVQLEMVLVREPPSCRLGLLELCCPFRSVAQCSSLG